MATFISDTITVATYVRARIVVEEISTDIINNNHQVKVYVQMWRTNSGYTTSGSGTLYIGIDGQGWASSTITSAQKVTQNSYTVMGSPRIATITHNSDGTKTLGFLAYTSTNVDNLNFSETRFTVTLSKIDRAAPSIELSVSNITANSLKISASANMIIDQWYYSLNNGSSYSSLSNSEGTSAVKTITGLTPNTTYNVKVKGRRKYNQVVGYSSVQNIKTIGNAELASANDTYADEATVTIAYKVTVYETDWHHKLSLYLGTTQIFESGVIDYNSAGILEKTYSLSAQNKSALQSAMSSLSSATLKLKLKTYTDSACTQQIGSTSETDCLVSFRSNVSKPVFTDFDYEDTNTTVVNVTGDDQVLVKGMSNLVISCAAGTAVNGSQITAYTAKFGDISSTSSNTLINAGVPGTHGTFSLEVACIDSRGFSTVITKQVTVLNYEQPKIDDFEIRRENEVEELIQLSFSGTISPIKADGETNTNTLTVVEFATKATDEEQFGTATSILTDVSMTGTSFSFESLELCELDDDTSFNFKLVLKDGFGNLTSIEVDRIVLVACPLISARKKTQTYPFRRLGINNPNPTAPVDVSGEIKGTKITATSGLSLFGALFADFVIDSGSSGGWNYQLMYSNTCVLWRKITAVYDSQNTHLLVKSENLPFEIFTSNPAPVVLSNMKLTNATNDFDRKLICKANLSGTAVAVYVTTPDGAFTSSSTREVDVLIIGKRKVT